MVPGMSTNNNVTDTARGYAADHWDTPPDLFDRMVETVEAFWPDTGWVPVTREALTEGAVTDLRRAGATAVAVEHTVNGRRADFTLGGA